MLLLEPRCASPCAPAKPSSCARVSAPASADRGGETAHEIALKAAETDATKRALATFGNPFGLALYDKELRGVTRRPQRDAAAAASELRRKQPLFDLRHTDGRTERFASVEAFVAATVQAVRALTTVEAVYAFWEANLDSFAALPRADKRRRTIPSQRLDRR